MLKKIIILFLGMVMLSGCADGFRNYFQKSANNKLIDSKGFQGSKRKPLYNNRYITLAKKNIVEDNIDEDDDGDDSDNDDSPFASEKINPLKRNRDMYLKMIKRDMENYNKGEGKRANRGFAHANQKVRANDTQKEKKLEQEIAQIKAMLREAKRDISRCSNVVPAVAQNYVAPVANYESNVVNAVDDNIDNSLYDKKSKVRQKFIREDEESACAI